ncbi:MAG: asparagine synthase (glutamine-hydrolyzing) [Desulfobacteraceae bacterium]|nr:asparagine synthase (glutamine-hydrolyzing) [Desulfobacteraceae bacterium]
MCGIVGIIQTNQKPVSRKLVETMTASLAHRGPDGWGVEIRGKEVALGHRRLSIIDPEGGKQPLSNEDGQIWVTANGGIYNYKELRTELEAKGHIFHTNSDTETIVHSYEEWGDQCVEHFRGMFAFGIMDLRQRRVFLARDHLGIKPLYYLIHPHFFAFGSELQLFRCIPGINFNPDLEAIDQYLQLGYISAPKTVFKQAYKLPPAHRMSIGFDGTVCGPEEYWELEFRPNYSRTEAEWVESLDAVLRDSVRAHLVSDVPFGAFLSGGMDSSGVLAYMSQILEKPVSVFSIGFEETDYSETEYAKKAAQRWEAEHHIEIVKPDALEILPKLVRHYGEPFGDSSAIPTYYVSKMARGVVPMVLSGDGGDESLAGYDRYCSWLKRLAKGGYINDYPAWKRIIRPFAHAIMPRRYPLFNSHKPTLENWLRYCYMDLSERRSLWRQEYHGLCNTPLDTMEKEFAKTRKYSLCSKVQYLDIKTYLPYDILTKVDVASMMHGLEVRTPFVDVRVMEFAATIPEHMNINEHYNTPMEGKLILKKAMKKYYHPEFIHRPKMGFTMPVERWFVQDDMLKQKIQERFLAPNSILSEYFDPSGVNRLVKENLFGRIWLLLFLEEWLEQNKPYLSAA